MNPGPCPPEPPIGTWVRDRFGGLSYRQANGGWGEPGTQPFGVWEAMWNARGPYVVCGEWGGPAPVFEPYVEPLSDTRQICPDCRQIAVWRNESFPAGWYHEDVDSRWCDMEHDERGPASDGGPRLARGWNSRQRPRAVSQHNADLWR